MLALKAARPWADGFDPAKHEDRAGLAVSRGEGELQEGLLDHGGVARHIGRDQADRPADPRRKSHPFGGVGGERPAAGEALQRHQTQQAEPDPAQRKPAIGVPMTIRSSTVAQTGLR